MATNNSATKTQISNITREINQYVNLKDRVNTIITSLGSSYDSLQKACDKISVHYTINNVQADNNKISTNRKQINQIHENLKNKIIPAIEQKLDSLKREKNNLEASLL